MIYVAGLSTIVHKAYPNETQASTIKKICQQMPMDPETSRMDVVILGPLDVGTASKQELVNAALETKHPDVCVIYIYSKPNEEDFIDCEYKKCIKKLKPANINEVFEEFVGPHKIRTGARRTSSADFDVPTDSIGDVTIHDEESFGGELPGDDEYSLNVVQMDNESAPEPEPEAEPEPEPEEEPTPVVAEKPMELPEPEPEPEPEPIPLDNKIDEPNPFQVKDDALKDVLISNEKIDNQIKNIKSYTDWALFKDVLHKDSVVRHLIEENSEYTGLVNTLAVLDKKIESVWRDSSLTPDQKFEQIKEIGMDKSVIRATQNSINVDRAINIIQTIIQSAKRAVDDRIEGINSAMYKLSTDSAAIMDTAQLDKAIQERTETQLELLNISRSIVDLYKSIDNFISDEMIRSLDEGLPSANQFINNMVRPLGIEVFTPANTAALANKLMRALQENRLIASQLEESVNAVIDTLFSLCEKDEEIIRYQQNIINLLRAHRVEDVVITDTMLKKVLRLYVGADNTGRSATTITWVGILSRRHNSLLIDLTGRSKFREYGIEPMSLEEFYNNRPEMQFLCVESSEILAPDQIQELIQVVKSRLNYYPYVNIILAPEDTVGLDMLSEEALTVHYITDCSTQSIRVMRNIITNHKYENIARKLVEIDCPVSPLQVADAVGCDPSITRVVNIPNMQAIRSCALRHDRPYEFTNIVAVFEEAFR